MNFGLNAETIKEIRKFLARYPEIRLALIFGSRSLGNFKKGSDIDLAIKGDNVDFETVSSLKAMLENETNLPYFFDIVDINTIENDELREHIREHGRVFYQA